MKILKKLITIVTAFALFAMPVMATHNPAVVDYTEEDVCEPTTLSAHITDENGTHKVGNMYLVVDDGDTVQSENIPTDGSDAEIMVGPFDETTTVYYRVFGGGERDYDDPAWNGYGDPGFGADVGDYGDTNGWGFVVAGTDNPNPFTTWHEVDVEGCDETAPLVQIDMPTDESYINGMVDISGFVTDDVELSHYNLSLYPGSVDLSDGDTHSGDRLNDTYWCTTPTSGTVALTDNFVGDFCTDWDTTMYPDGEYQIRLAARDAAGNRDLSDPENGGTSSVHVIQVMINNDDKDNDGVEVDVDCDDTDPENTAMQGTKACQLYTSGVMGKGIMKAAGLIKEFNEKSQAMDHAGKK